MYHPSLLLFCCMIFVYTPQLIMGYVKDKNIFHVFPFPFIGICFSYRRIYVPISISYVWICMRVNFFLTISIEFFCHIGNFKSFRFLSTMFCSLLCSSKLLKSFFRFRLLCSEARQNFQRDLMMKCVFLR